jgi:DNA-directed RNA polymerase subunit L
MALNVNILEEKKHKLVFEIDGDTHTLAAALTKELWNDEHVKVAGYNVDHPLLGKPKFVIETDGADPKKIVSAAAKRLSKAAEKLRDAASKELK